MSLRTRWRPNDRFLVRHKDSSLLVVEKKAGLLTTATPTGRGDNLMTLLAGFIQARGPRPAIFAVHRLDRPVSGLLVVARTSYAAEIEEKQFAAHTVERVYVAAVQGILREDEGTYESRLASDHRTLRMRSGEEGKIGITHWRVLERYPRADATLVEVTLETGLRNQIRAHFAEAGHPLLGERKYLPEEDPDADSHQGAQRIFLHAAVLGFLHPITHQAMTFTAPLPADLVTWRRKLEGAPNPRAGRKAGPRPPRPRQHRHRPR